MCVHSLFASLLKKYTRVSHKIHNASSSVSSSSASAANHHDNSVCVVDGVDETDLVCDEDVMMFFQSHNITKLICSC